MEEPEPGGKRMPARKGSPPAESQPQRTTAPAQPRPAPKPVQKTAPGVPMAGRSYAQKQAQTNRVARTDAAPATAPPPAAPAPRPRPAAQPPAQAPARRAQDLDLDEEFDLADEDVYVEEAPAPSSRDTKSSIYSTRRALAEQVNQEVGVKPDEGEGGVAAIREKREAWKRAVAAKEEEGKSPYVTRWAKVSFFPMLYFVISLSLLRKIRFEYSEYYDYDPFFLLMGLMVGFVFLVLAATGTMLRAKRVKKPIQLKGGATWIGVIVFIGVSFYLAFFEGLAYAWMFSIGFLAAGLLIVLIGFLLEKSGKGTYWVKDPLESSDKRWLEFVPISEA